RVEHREEIDKAISSLIEERPLAEIERAFLHEGVAFCPVYTVADLVADAHIAARGNLVADDDDGCGRPVLMQAPVPSFSRTPGSVRSVGPEAGDHTEEVLTGLLGLAAADVAELRAEGVV